MYVSFTMIMRYSRNKIFQVLATNPLKVLFNSPGFNVALGLNNVAHFVHQ